MGEDTQAPEVPGDLDQLIAELSKLRYMPPVERARRIPGLITGTRTILTTERATAILEANASGLKNVEIAKQLGISRQQITKIAEGPKSAKESQNDAQGE
jgi:DNA-binding NarL/FixJ family response regulator